MDDATSEGGQDAKRQFTNHASYASDTTDKEEELERKSII